MKGQDKSNQEFNQGINREYELISRGAEAIIYAIKGNSNLLVKFRPVKHFRIKEIDSPLRKYRTRREARIIERLSKLNFPSPKLIDVDENKGIIVMEKIEGKKLRDVINNENFKSYCTKLGELIAILHKNNIIHDDLTTSNFLVGRNKKIFVIDFGLSYISPKVEDKAVDLHLLKQGLESKHFEFWREAFNTVLKSYKNHYLEAETVINRLNKVEERGRYKRKKTKIKH